MITYCHNNKIISYNTFNNSSTIPPSINKGGISKLFGELSTNEAIDVDISLYSSLIFNYDSTPIQSFYFSNILLPSGYTI